MKQGKKRLIGEKSGGWLILGCLSLLPMSCQKPFDVNVKAEEPIKVDLEMDVHVYQHGGSTATVKTASSQKTNGIDAYAKALDSRRNRMEEIQTLKNNSFVGENHLGLLELRKIPDGDYGKYVKKTVREENSDRRFLMEYESKTQVKEIETIQSEHWRHAQRKSFPGELIETEDPDNPGTYIWIKKSSPAGSSPSPDEKEEDNQ